MNQASAAPALEGTTPPYSRRLALAVTATALTTELVGIPVALLWNKPSAVLDPGFMTGMAHVVELVPWSQWIIDVVWAGLTGINLALGVGPRALSGRSWCVALLAGVLVPVGFVVLATTWSRFWPATTRPWDQPVLAPTLLVYSLLVPWGIGRMLRGARHGVSA